MNGPAKVTQLGTLCNSQQYTIQKQHDELLRLLQTRFPLFVYNEPLLVVCRFLFCRHGSLRPKHLGNVRNRICFFFFSFFLYLQILGLSLKHSSLILFVVQIINLLLRFRLHFRYYKSASLMRDGNETNHFSGFRGLLNGHFR